MRLLIICLFISFIITISAQPEAPVRMCAEWEPARGTLIRWPLGIPYSLVTELAADDSLYVLVEDQNEAMTAIDEFIGQGVNLEHCEFIMADTYSHWTRDWGPVSIFDGDLQWGIIDPWFEGYPWVPGGAPRWWEEDDAVNQVLGNHFNCPVYQLPAYFTGGNIMVDGHGNGYSTIQMVDENLPYMTEAEFLQYIEAHTGLDNYFFTNNIEDYGIQHIDCGAKLLDEETVIVKELPTWHPEHDRMEQVAEFFSQTETCYNRSFNVHRIFCGPYNGNEVAAYTNSLILNGKVLVPLFGIDSDGPALDVYEMLMPGYEVIGFFYSSWYYYDALHCRTRAIFYKDMLLIRHKRPYDFLEDPEGFDLAVEIIDHSSQGLIPEELLVHWKLREDSEWEQLQLQSTATTDSFTVNIPVQEDGTIIEYYFSAAGISGQAATLPVTAPEGYYSFEINDGSASEDDLISPIVDVRNYPNPFNPSTTISFLITTEFTENTEISIINLKGQTIKKFSISNIQYSISNNQVSVIWNGTDHNNQPVSSGIYFYKITAGDKSVTRKCLLLK